jgi:2-hydroxychromene-2-carboxylate isomerase
MPTLEFFYDCSSPWTYLAFHRIEEVAARSGAELIWKPILVGGVFNAVNQSVYENRANPVPVKAAYAKKDQQSWARFYGIRIGSPPVFPVNSVKAMRAAFVAQEHGRISPFSRAVFEAYWGDLQDISQDDVLQRVVERVGLDWTEVKTKIATDEYKKKLRDNVDELIARGGFGSPTMYVDRDDMYFGNDRLPLVEHALAEARDTRAAAGSA